MKFLNFIIFFITAGKSGSAKEITYTATECVIKQGIGKIVESEKNECGL